MARVTCYVRYSHCDGVWTGWKPKNRSAFHIQARQGQGIAPSTGVISTIGLLAS